MSRPTRVSLVAIWTSLLVVSSAWGKAQEVVFELVPSERWEPENLGGMKPLSRGTVYLYREGRYEPDLVVEVGEEAKVPPGKWVWSAESDEGFVSVAAGTINIPADDQEHPPRWIYWPVERACHVVLSPESSWHGVQRLDVVSIGMSSVYPIDPRRRQDLWAPVGRLFAYSVGPRGLLGIDDLGQCSHREVLKIAPPRAPDAGHQEFMISVQLRDGEVAARDTLEASVTRPGHRGLVHPPEAAVWVEGRGTFFFLNVPASEELELRFHHPRLRTRTVSLEPLGGSARELREMHLQPRRDLTLEVDYQPARAHHRVEIDAYRCGLARELSMTPLSTCKPVGPSKTMVPGLHSYVFEDLDDGKYYLEAWVDDQVMPGLGFGLYPYLDPESDEVPVLDRALVHEFEVYGSLLLDGEAVPGTVELLPVVLRDRTLPARRFRTGDDLRYHLYYFGRIPGIYETPPDYDDSGSVEDRLGLYADAEVTACSAEGFCRPYPAHSVLQGSGRFDLDLGRGTRVEIQVVDAVNGRAIGGARVFTRVPGDAFYFHHGEVDWFEPPGREGVYLATDGQGRARLRWTGENKIPLGVNYPGYERFRGLMEVVPGEDNQLEVALEPKDQDRAVSHLRFPDGAPVEDAYLLVVGPGGERNGQCSRPAGADGAIDLPDNCLRGHTVVVIAPGARISPLEGAAIPSFPEVSIPRAPSRPVRLRILDSDGDGVEGVPVALRYGKIVLNANDFLLAATYTGHQLFYLSDGAGEITLRGVDPEAVPVPEVGIGLGGDMEWFSLNGYLRGETVSLTLN